MKNTVLSPKNDLNWNNKISIKSFIIMFSVLAMGYDLVLINSYFWIIHTFRTVSVTRYGFMFDSMIYLWWQTATEFGSTEANYSVSLGYLDDSKRKYIWDCVNWTKTIWHIWPTPRILSPTTYVFILVKKHGNLIHCKKSFCRIPKEITRWTF